MKNMNQKEYNPYFDYPLILEIANSACDSIDEMLSALDIDFRRSGRMVAGPCPVHGGNNTSAWNLYPEGEEVRGFWKCRTHHCETEENKEGKKLYGCTLVGFVRGVLSHRKGKYVSYIEAVKWVVKFLGYKDINEVAKPSEQTIEKRKYVSSVKKLNLTPKETDTGWDKAKIRSKLIIPSEYYLERKYSEEVLDKYDVGLYDKMNRVVLPVYDEKHKKVAGFVGRSIYNECGKCGCWHGPEDSCPKQPLDFKYAAKWLNSKGFETAHYLYNYWFALEHIRECKVAILVEGAGDVWRLEENGIHIGLALFGTEMTEQQRVLLDRSGAMSIIVLLDPDKAGRDGIEKIKKQLGRQYRLYFPNISDDVGGLEDDEITQEIKPIIEKVQMI